MNPTRLPSRRASRRTSLRAFALAAMFAPMLALPIAALAEKADREQPTQIEAAHQTYDDLKQVSVFTGSVVLTRGTLRVTGERIEYREDAEGYQSATVTSVAGRPATFHERLDSSKPGVESIVDGQADRIDYDGRSDTVRLTGNAVVRRFENGEPRDEMNGAVIVYDNRNATYDVSGGTAAAPAASTSGGRVRLVIAPRKPGDGAAAGAGTVPKPATRP